MGYNVIIDNKYPIGSTVYAVEKPLLKLVVKAYYQRAYYCAVFDEPERKQLVYFERELLTPEAS